MKARLKWFVALGAFAAVAFAAVRLTSDRPAPPQVLPVPNGYDDFLAAGRLVEPRTSNWQALATAELAPVVASNAAALKLLRAGLAKESCARLEVLGTNFDRAMAPLHGGRWLTLALCAEGRLALLERRTNDAVLAAVDCVRFGEEFARGGPLVNRLAGIAIWTQGQRALSPLLPALDAATLRRVAQSLEAQFQRRESLDQMLRHEADWTRLNFTPTQRLIGRIGSFIASPAGRPGVDKINLCYRDFAGLIMECGAQAFLLERGRAPTNAVELVPDFLRSIPSDPVSGQPMTLPAPR